LEFDLFEGEEDMDAKDNKNEREAGAHHAIFANGVNYKQLKPHEPGRGEDAGNTEDGNRRERVLNTKFAVDERAKKHGDVEEHTNQRERNSEDAGVRAL